LIEKLSSLNKTENDMRYMTEKDTSKYSDTQLFRMWEKQNQSLKT